MKIVLLLRKFENGSFQPKIEEGKKYEGRTEDMVLKPKSTFRSLGDFYIDLDPTPRNADQGKRLEHRLIFQFFRCFNVQSGLENH